MLEGEITKQIQGWLKTLPGVWSFKVHGHKPGPGGSQKTGIPDLCIESIRHGRIWVEVKRPGETLTDSQKKQIPLMQSAGATVLVVYSLQELQSEMDLLEIEIGGYK